MNKQVQTQNALSVALYGEEGNPVEKAIAVGDMFAQSGLFGVSNVAQGHVLALECITRNLAPGVLLERYHIIEGRLSLRSDYMLAEFQRRGGSVEWLKTGSKSDNFEARAKFKKGKSSVEESYSFEDAKEAGICFGKNNDLKKNWKTSRPDMVRARLISKTIRFLDPGINSGLYTSEEIGDFDETESPLAPPVETEAQIFTETPPKSTEKAVKADNSPAVDAELVEDESKPGESSGEESQKDEEIFEGEFADLFSKMKENEVAVDKFLIAKAWIAVDQTFRDTPPNRLKMIAKRPEDFLNAAKRENKEG